MEAGAFRTPLPSVSAAKSGLIVNISFWPAQKAGSISRTSTAGAPRPLSWSRSDARFRPPSFRILKVGSVHLVLTALGESGFELRDFP
jgi:hypothetical protein